MLKSGVIIDILTCTYIHTCTHMYLCTHLVAGESRHVPRYLDRLCRTRDHATLAYLHQRVIRDEYNHVEVVSTGLVPCTLQVMLAHAEHVHYPIFAQLRANRHSQTYVVAYQDLPPPGEPQIHWPRDPSDHTRLLSVRETVSVCDC